MKHLLVVDDDKLNLVMAFDTLKKYYIVSIANSGGKALDVLKEKEVDLILLDIEMPVMNGIETLEKIKQNPKTARIPVIFLTAINDNKVEAKCIELGAQDYIVKPFYEPSMIVRIRRTLELDDLRKNLEGLVAEKTQEIECLTIQTITSFANSIDAKDSYTKYHSQHVAKYAEMMARKMGWEKNEIRNLYFTALLHDIGKIGIPDYILNKPGKLTDEEYTIIKNHPVVGGDILSEVTVVPYLSIGARNHHERFDGRGYPDGKKGEEIPLVGRIVSIADAVDAMISTRAYREGGSVSYAIEELLRCSGSQFDPKLVPIMIEILQEGINFLDEEDFSQDQSSYDKNGSLISVVLSEYARATQLDSTTGLWNKSYMQKKINELLILLDRDCLFLLIDIENYSSAVYFDENGQIEGFMAILAQCIKMELGDHDFAGRYDNNKIVAYLKDIKDMEQAEYRILQILKSINQKILDIDMRDRINVNIGATIPADMDKDFMTLYHNADKALYFTKHDRKKSYCIYAESSLEEMQNWTREAKADLWVLKTMMVERTEVKGAFQVGIQDFERLVKLFQRKSKRSGEHICMLLFTFQAEENMAPIVLDEVSKILMAGLDKLLRTGDIVTRYGRCQHVVLLTETDEVAAKKISKRVQDDFYQEYLSPLIKLNCEVAKIT